MIMKIKKVTKAFGGLVAVNNIDMDIEAGKIHAVIGPNGAGKTTFFNGITGINPMDSGEIFLENENIQNIPTHIITTKGISRTFQNIRLFPYMTVLENVKVGTHTLTKSLIWDAVFKTRRFKREEKEIEEFCLQLLESTGLTAKKDFRAKNLPYGEQRKLEIARALASKPKVLLLDEPAAGMNDTETADLVNYIKGLSKQGITVILIEHDMKLVMSIADTISVIDHGIKIAEGSAEEIQNNEKVIEAYLGKRRAV
jgi:branched-chain amino acid transport system ATP-binding protein